MNDSAFRGKLDVVAIATGLVAVSAAQAQPAVCEAPPNFVADPPPVSQGYFASDIAIDGDGDMAIVGEIFGEGQNPALSESGTARIFSRPSGQWQEVQWIRHLDPEANDRFGASVDISGSCAIIAAPQRLNIDGSIGAAYIFERDLDAPITQQWSQQTEITNPAGPAGNNDGFGGSLTQHETVGIDGRFAVVGASGANNGVGVVYVFYNSGGTWELEATLANPNPQSGSQFGYCVDISGTRVIVGSPYLEAEGFEVGRAYVFRRNVPETPKWVLEDELIPSPKPQSYHHVGWSVSIDGTSAVVGAPHPGLEPVFPAGSGYAVVYRRVGSDWTQDTMLNPSSSQVGQFFGYAVSVSGTLALIGSPGYEVEGLTSVGTVYQYQRLPSGWTQTVRLFSSDPPVIGDRCGETLALDGNEVFVGILSDESPGQPSGENWGSVLISSDIWNCAY